MRAHRRLLPLAVVAALGMSGCVKSTAQNPFAPQGTRSGEGSIRVLVENQNFGDATVFALRGGERVRLGTVTGKSDETFNVRWNFSLSLEFEINIIGGQGCRVRPMPVDPGDQVFVRIPTEVTTQACYSGKNR